MQAGAQPDLNQLLKFSSRSFSQQFLVFNFGQLTVLSPEVCLQLVEFWQNANLSTPLPDYRFWDAAHSQSIQQLKYCASSV